MDEQNQNVQKVDLYRIFRLTLRQAKYLWWVVLVLALLISALMGFRSARAYVPIYQATATYAASKGLKVNAGHGLTYHNVQAIAALPEMHELNIGHAIIV